MTLLIFFSLLFCISYIAGILGALTGLGGGIVLTPILVTLLHIDIYYAMGASLIAVMTASSGTSIAYLNKGYTNLRIGLFLETGAVIGALIGASLITMLKPNIITGIFGMVLLVSAYLTWYRREDQEPATLSHPWAIAMQLEGKYPLPISGMQSYKVQKVPLAWVIMFIAGILSSLLGIGSGALKVLAMDQAMRLPYKVATATSNFIIGITAAVSVGIYFARGYIDPVLTCSVMSGVLLGSVTGAKMLHRIDTQILRLIFSIVIILLAIQMIYQGLLGKLSM